MHRAAGSAAGRGQVPDDARDLTGRMLPVDAGSSLGPGGLSETGHVALVNTARHLSGAGLRTDRND